MKVCILKYNAGNIRSVANALARLGAEATVSDRPDDIKTADKVIFPGVGEASSAMTYLRARGLDNVLRSLTQPVLGICLGMQLMCQHSEENDTECLGILPHRVAKFESTSLKVPHVGWNTVASGGTGIFQGVNTVDHLYFVHGYYVKLADATIATCTYGETFSAAIQHNNFYAVQFHPEKSGVLGQRILRNFINL